MTARLDIDGAASRPHSSAPAAVSLTRPATVLDDLEAGRIRAAEPDPAWPDGWRVNPEVKSAILACFADRTTIDWEVGPLTFRDRAAVPPRPDLAGGPWRIVPGGSAVRRGAHLGAGVVVMPPSYVNIGAWVGPGSMVDSHVLVGSCAQIGADV
ncbi:MAG: 2,3,4,5-tetrahydropyridine-2,6-dicarboxylate N-succinyltransferase, partial [Chloroflexota bacterium]